MKRITNVKPETRITKATPETALAQGHEGTILAFLMNDGCKEFLHRLAEHLFSFEIHREIFRAIQDVFDEREKVNCISVSNRLSEKRKLEECGGRPHVTDISLQTTSAEIAESALECLIENYAEREAANIGKDLAASNITADVAEQRLAELNRSRQRNGAFPEGVPLMTLAERKIDHENTLLGNRFLCIGGIMFFVGPSGVGKSSVSAQQDISWALGRPAFHIRPARPLRILCIQAENDEDDLTEMSSGVANGLNLTPEEREIVRRNVIYISDCSHTGVDFLAMVEHYLKKYAPIDLVRIDPLLAYLGGDILSVEITSKFVRNGLNALLRKYHCGAIINHHTPKPINIDRSEWKPHDWMYFGSGNADLTNAPRATMSMDSTHTADVFEFRAGKRGRRTGWIDEKGEPVFVRYFCWEKGDKIFWRDATDEDIERVQSVTPRRHAHTTASKGSIEDLFALIPLDGSIEKNVLLQRASAEDRGDLRIAEKRARAFLTELIDTGRAFPWRIKRPKTNPRIEISRHEQSLV